MGHILVAPLPSFGTLAELATFAGNRYAADLEPGIVFAELPFGTVAALRDGTIVEAEVVVRRDGLTWVVVA